MGTANLKKPENITVELNLSESQAKAWNGIQLRDSGFNSCELPKVIQLSGGMLSGKTFIGLNWLVVSAIQRPHTFSVTDYWNIDKISEILTKMGLVEGKNFLVMKPERLIKLWNGSKISCIDISKKVADPLCWRFAALEIHLAFIESVDPHTIALEVIYNRLISTSSRSNISPMMVMESNSWVDTPNNNIFWISREK